MEFSFSIHSTMPYLHARLDSRIEQKYSDWFLCVYVFASLCFNFLSSWVSLLSVIVAFSSHTLLNFPVDLIHVVS